MIQVSERGVDTDTCWCFMTRFGALLENDDFCFPDHCDHRDDCEQGGLGVGVHGHTASAEKGEVGFDTRRNQHTTDTDRTQTSTHAHAQ